MPSRSESSIERSVVEYAKKRGMLVRKMNGVGNAGWPDRLFITKNGRVFWVEFKRFGGKLSVIQNVMIGELIGHGQHVYVVDNVQYGQDIVAGEDV